MGFVRNNGFAFLGALALPVEDAFAFGRAMLYVRRTSVAFFVVHQDNFSVLNGEAEFVNLGVGGL